MKKNLRSFAAVALALSLVFGLAACGSTATDAGSKSPSPTGEASPEYVYVAEYTELLKNSENYLSPRLYANGGYYATSYEKVGENIPEGVTPEYEGQYDVYRTFLYFISDEGKLTKLEGYVPLDAMENTENYQDFSSGSDLSGLAVASDGSIVTVEYVYSSWFDGPEGMTRNSNEYYDHYNYSQKYYLRWLDSDGAEKSSAEISVNPDEYIDAYNMKMDSKDNVVFSTGSGLRAIAADGTVSYSITDGGYVDSLVSLPDGSISALVWSDADQQQMFMPIDEESGSFGTGVPAPSTAYGAVSGDSNYDLYYTSGVNFYGLNLDGSEPVKLFNWLSCDVNSSELGRVYVSGEGQFTGFVVNWDQNSETYTVDKVTVDKVPSDSVPKKETISMAAMYLDYQVLNQIINFNRSNDKYRIEVTDYSEYNNTAEARDAMSTSDENPGLTKLNTEIMAGNVPDILALSGLNYTQLASKGILEDLYPYIDSDKTLDRDDFFPNVLSAMEVDGKLCTTVSNYYISTVIGASSVVGDEPGWTYEEFEAALASMPEGCSAFDQYITRSDILQNCLALDMGDFVNWATGECSFDSQQFVELLNFANRFPAEFDWENYNYDYSQGEDTATRLAQGKQMLVQSSLYSIDDVLYNSAGYLKSLGGSITYVGFPTANGTGNMLGMTDGGYAMSSKSENKEAVWEFMRTFFTDEYQKTVGWSLPSSKAVFEEKVKDASTVKYQKDSDGNYLLDDKGEKIPIAIYSIWNSETQTNEDIYALTEEQVNQIRALISTTDKVADYNSNIFSIVNTEVSAFFEGQKSAEEVAKLIQSKANIYVNEQR